MQRKSADDNIRIIEHILYKEQAIREAVEDYRASRGGHSGGAPSGHAFISDPTAGEAIRNVEEICVVTIDSGERIFKPERWLLLINELKVWAEKDSIKCGLLKRRYHGEDYKVTCLELAISQATYSTNLQEIRAYALAIACQLELVKLI